MLIDDLAAVARARGEVFTLRFERGVFVARIGGSLGEGCTPNAALCGLRDALALDRPLRVVDGRPDLHLVPGDGSS
ncbi:MAG: hypothetical protein WKF48_05870 [Solirubrobacteraceae bacterium]